MHRTIAIGVATTLLAIAATAAVGCGLKKKSDPSSDFHFASDPATAYVQVDRVGMPAVATAVITSKDSYNTASPADDASGLFVPQIQANVAAIHAKLDDDLIAAGLTPASTGTSISQAAPLIVPDTLKVDTAAASGFPNGRKLPDPVVDVTLAVVLLDFGVGGQNATTLAGLPLDPAANDRAFSASFPYLASPH